MSWYTLFLLPLSLRFFLIFLHDIQIDAFDSWRLHESEIQAQGNQRFFFLAASRLVLAASQLDFVEKNNLRKPLRPEYFFYKNA